MSDARSESIRKLQAICRDSANNHCSVHAYRSEWLRLVDIVWSEERRLFGDPIKAGGRYFRTAEWIDRRIKATERARRLRARRSLPA